MADSNARPLIVKRKKVVAGGGHHGGAWKVAYADFVTAMMAFFMLMWLLNATTDKQRKGLADYFSPTVPVARSSGGGDGAFGGTTLTAADGSVLAGTGGLTETALQGFGDGAAAAEAVREAILGRGGDSVLEDADRRNVTVRLSDEGVVIELFALDGRPLFDPGTARPTALLRRLVATVAPEAARGGAAGVALAAHLAALPPPRAPRAPWPLSTDRALALRAALVRAGLPEARLRRVAGHGDRAPAVEPAVDPRNDRLEIVLLRPGA